MKVKTIVLIVLGILVAGVIYVLVSSRGAIFNAGVPLGGVTYTAGSILGVPAYPGATQTTEAGSVGPTADMRRVISKEAQWKRYTTADSPSKVIDWYKNAIVAAGFEAPRVREGGELLFTTADTRYMIYAATDGGQTTIILGAGKE